MFLPKVVVKNNRRGAWLVVTLYGDSRLGLLYDNSRTMYYLTLNVLVKTDFIGHYKLNGIESV